jgi:H+/Cl- antiporter ClcA
MPDYSYWRGLPRRLLQELRLRASHAEALPTLIALGLTCGLLAGGGIIAFRLFVESTQAQFLPGGDPENYEALSTAWRVWLPLAGGAALGVVFHFLPTAARHVGVVHVMERLAYHQGRLPLRNALVQFFGAAASIIAGHSMGREGPAIHLGAASGSLSGQALGLPNNSLRVLAGCGVAGAIAAAFNTPLAGVVFAMEVIMMEYTVAGFAPVILAAVGATALSRLVFGPQPALAVPAIELGSLLELPYILALGIAIGALAAAFIVLVRMIGMRLDPLPVWARMTLAGAFTGLLAVPVPQIMGIGYDTANAALLGQLGFGLLLAVVLAKLLATSAAVGAGLPGGLIGPTLVMGAAAGGAFGLLAQALAPTHASSSGLYAVLGMGAMMAGALQAPLAALTAVFELTGNPHVIMPGMLAVVAAAVSARVIFRQASVFVVLLRTRGLDYRHDPVVQSLRRTGVGGVMDKNVAIVPQFLDHARARDALARRPAWLLVQTRDGYAALLPAIDMAQALGEPQANDPLDLLAIPAQRRQVVRVTLQATLQEALDALDRSGAEAAYVGEETTAGAGHVHGVLTREQIERSYRYG